MILVHDIEREKNQQVPNKDAIVAFSHDSGHPKPLSPRGTTIVPFSSIGPFGTAARASAAALSHPVEGATVVCLAKQLLSTD